jgi:hypothetical protein
MVGRREGGHAHHLLSPRNASLTLASRDRTSPPFGYNPFSRGARASARASMHVEGDLT